jgi:hypothetical protein
MVSDFFDGRNPMSRDIDEIIERVKTRIPLVRVWQHWVKNPTVDDDGLWSFAHPNSAKGIQLESSFGMCPFMVEHDDMKCTSEAEFAHSVDEAVEKIVSYLSRAQDGSAHTEL